MRHPLLHFRSGVRTVTCVIAALLIFLCTNPAFSRGNNLPARLTQYLRTNELMGLKPSNLAEFKKMMGKIHAPSTQEHGGFVRSLQQDTATFTDSGIHFPGVWGGGVGWFDFDNNGWLDATDCGQQGGDTNRIAAIYRRDSTGTLTQVDFDVPGLDGATPAWADYDNDGDFDLLITGSVGPLDYNCLSLLFRNYHGVLIQDTSVQLMGLIGACSWVDYDNDGQMDIFLTGSPDNGSSWYSKLYHNDHGVFTEVPTSIQGMWGGPAKWADYDNDGDMDLLITGYGGGVMAKIYRNDGNGVFTDIGASIQPNNSGDAEWFDFDNDGDLDIVMIGTAPGGVPFTTIYRNDGNDTFTDIQPGLVALSVSSVATGDYDGDGYTDIAITGNTGNAGEIGTGTLVTKVYHNNGNGTFTDIDAALPGTWFGSVEWADYDKDGRLDLTVAGATIPWYPGQPYDVWLDPFATVYHNNSPNPSVRPLPPGSVNFTHVGGGVQITWDAPANAPSGKSAFSYNVRIGSTTGGIDIVAPMSDVTSGFRKMPVHGNASRRMQKTIALPDGAYYCAVQAINNGLAASAFSTEKEILVGLPANAPRWQLVSAPIATPTEKTTLYPTAVSNCYAYGGGYQNQAMMQRGAGYWLKFYKPDGFTVSGAPVVIDRDTIHLHKGWNLVGSVSQNVTVANIVTIPPMMIQPNSVYGYNNGYSVAATITPFSGYWVKAVDDCLLILDPASSAGAQTTAAMDTRSTLSRLDVTDATGLTQSVYFGPAGAATVDALPPLPPDGVFDVRFATESSVALTAEKNPGAKIALRISGAAYPVSIRWDNRSGVRSVLHVDGKEVALTGTGSVQVPDAGARVDLAFSQAGQIPDAFALGQNYPNPFNPSTQIGYSLPVDANVRLTVFDLLGRTVTMLADGVQTAGEKTITLNAAGLASGLYFYRLEAVSVANPANTCTMTRKLSIVK